MKPAPRSNTAMGKLSCFAALSLAAWIAPAPGAPVIKLADGVVNPPAAIELADDSFVMADAAAVFLVPSDAFYPILKATMDAQGFTQANNWILPRFAVPLADDATFNITSYNLLSNAAGNKFGELMNFNLSPNSIALPSNPPRVFTHWLQLINEDKAYGGFGYTIAGLPGYWELDNGDLRGGLVGDAAVGPYYDSNAGGNIRPDVVPPKFHDAPSYYAGSGTYLHFYDIPVEDVYEPATGNTPASDTLVFGGYGLKWGFSIVPEPSSMALTAVAFLGWLACGRRRRSDPAREPPRLGN